MTDEQIRKSVLFDPETEAFRLVPAGLRDATVNELRELAAQARQLTEQAVDAKVEFEKHAQGWLSSDIWGLEPVFRAGATRNQAVSALRDVFADSDLHRLAARCVGDSGVFSLSFSVFRRQTPPSNSRLAWHQDAKVYGPGIHSLNAWIPLDPCGEQAPGLELVDEWLPGLAPGVEYNSQRGQPISEGYDAYVDGASERRETPVFRPGDFLVFHERTVHRTAHHADYSQGRTAVELRFFNRVPTNFLWGINVPLRDFQRLELIG